MAGIPAGPYRGVDHGMVGSIVAWYPLQLFPPTDSAMRSTIDTLVERFFHQGLFFQGFIHSGTNPYLTLQIAHALLYAGDRAAFRRILEAVAAVATATGTYPEAIHPITGGGVVGDGHHGWAAAEVVLAARDAFVREVWSPGHSVHRLVLLSGIPMDWFEEGRRFGIASCPVPEGVLSLRGETIGGLFQLELEFERRGEHPVGEWSVELPFEARLLETETDGLRVRHARPGETAVTLRPASGVFRIERLRPTESAPAAVR